MPDENQPKDIYLVGKPTFVKWVIKYSGGLIKSERQANYILLAVIIIFFVTGVFIFVNSSIKSIEQEYKKYGYPKPPGVEAYDLEENSINNEQNEQ